MEISEVKSELNKLGQSMVKTEDVNELKNTVIEFKNEVKE